MRKTICLLVLALAACGENSGWNPNYSAEGRSVEALYEAATPYDRYKAQREKALTGQRDTPVTIPVARPVKAPTAAEIAGPNLGQIIVRDTRAMTAPRRAVATGRPVAVAVVRDPSATNARYAAVLGHPQGVATWPRKAGDDGRARQLCRTYASPDAAEADFIARGGPQVDPAGLDPDGDGYVCGWAPRPPQNGAGL